MNSLSRSEMLDQLKLLGLKIKSITGDEVVAHCPFTQNHKNNDKSPSFGINLSTGKFLCRTGCIKGSSFEELYTALTGEVYLGQKMAGYIELPENKVTKFPQIPDLPLAINNFGFEYLTQKRGLTKDSIIKWGIKYWSSINGIVIPIEQIGYVIRYLDATTTKDKYKYVAGTKITNCLFGESKLDFNLKFYIILVEGALDTISLHQKGFANTMSLLHIDVSDIQMKILKKYNMPVYLLLDGDAPGKEATEKLEKKLKYNFYVKKCYLPDEKDPDELSKEELEKILN